MRLTLVIILGMAFSITGCGSSYDPAESKNLLDQGNQLLAEIDQQFPTEKHQFTWEYEKSQDPMSDKQVQTACITSSNAVQLSPPYEPTRANLCLRNHPQHGRDAYVALEKDGQVLCRSYEYCSVRIRFDKSSAQKFNGVGSSDGSTNIFFIKDRAKLEAEIRKASVTAIEAEYYQAGQQTLLFDTKGLNWLVD